MRPYSSDGVYVNYLGQEADEGAERVKSAYGPEKYARLVALKEKYDPTNLFRLNQNIRPRRAKAKPPRRAARHCGGDRVKRAGDEGSQ
jgi:Berberine and berberine like